ncbi:MAG: hypothetical protein J3K34DRAFT_462869 [Monoraphidium minutum]|nr:MAG: hypothetical protein J3K34DRAFT_462869 [Monoraphidium minutum]
MVHEAELEAHVDGFDAQGFFDAVYADPAPMTRYHAAVNGCGHAAASPWLDGRRTVKFTLQVALPAAFQKIVGAGPIGVREVQSVEWQGGGCFVVTSQPELTFPGAANFHTTAELTAREAPCGAGGVALAARVRCSAGVPWVVQSAVEGLMLEQARASLSGFLGFCQDLCRERLAGGSPPRSQRPQPPAAGGGKAAGAEAAAAAVAVVVEARGLGAASDGEGSVRIMGSGATAAPATPPPAGGGGRSAAPAPALAAPVSMVPAAAASAAPAAAVAARAPDDASEAGEEDDDEFFDAYEAHERRPRPRGGYVAADAVEALAARVGELAAAQLGTNRLLQEMEARLRGAELEVARARAYQEGHAAALQLLRAGAAGWGSGSGVGAGGLALLAAAAAAGGAAAVVLMRRK